MIPVIPPIVNVTMKPTTNSSGVFHTGRPTHIVTSQAKIWMPAGTPMAMLAAEKKLDTIGGSPTANMWCAHRAKDMKPMATKAATSHG